MSKTKSLVQDCVSVVVIITAALLLMLGLNPWLEMTQSPFLLFFGAIPLAGLYVGRWGGIITTVLTALLANFFFISPSYSFSFDVVSSGRTLIFLLEGTLISILTGALRLAQQQTQAGLYHLKASETKFRRLVDSNIVGVASCDIHGAITDANDALLNSLGYTREDLRAGHIRWDAMTPADVKHLDVLAVEELISTGKSTPYEKAFIGKQGQRVPVVVGAALLEDDPEQLISFILDVSKRKRVEQRLAVQYAVARALAEATTMPDAISLVLQSLCECLGWQLGFFWRVEPQTNTLCYSSHWCSSHFDAGSLIAANQKMSFTYGAGLPGRIWKGGQPAWVAELEQAPNFPRKAIALEARLRSVFAFPVSVNQEILGVIECFSERYQDPDNDLLQMVAAIGSQIGQFVERKQTEEELQANQALFQSFMNYSPANAFIKDESGRYIYVNAQVERAFDRSAAEWIGKTDFDVFPPDVAQTIRDNDLAALQSEHMTQVAESAPLADEEHYYLSFKFPIRDAAGRVLLAGMSIDISDRKRFEVEREQLLQKLETSLGQLEAVVNSMTEGLIITDPLGNILMLNSAALALHEYTSVEEVRRHVHEFSDIFQTQDLEGNVIPVEQWPIARAVQGETFSNCEIQVRHRDTGKYWVGSYSGTPVRDKQGHIILAIVTIRDVTEAKRSQAELARSLASEKAARAEAEAANRIKDEFLAVLSHELRTPLNPILGWVRLLRNNNLDHQRAARALETIERNTKLQIQLIDDLLDISRILQGKLTLNVSSLDIVAIIEAAQETVRLAAEAKDIDLQFNVKGNEAPYPYSIRVMGDAGRLQQVVWNLLSNAIKFTPEGGRVTVTLEQVEGRGGTGETEDGAEPQKGEDVAPEASLALPLTSSYAQITISDTGRGIHPSFLPHIFEYFRQADSSTTRKFGGLGLGLAIARQIVELHGGTIIAESAGEGQGATFTVWLPLQPRENDRTLPGYPREAIQTSQQLLTGLHVLAVDDETDNLELVQFVLEQAGATVTVQSSALKTVQQVLHLTPDVLVIDIGMPGMDGYTLIRKIRELRHGETIPAIALTAYAGEFNQQQALAAGFQQHISKPVEPDSLVEAIATLTKRENPATAENKGLDVSNNGPLA